MKSSFALVLLLGVACGKPSGGISPDFPDCVKQPAKYVASFVMDAGYCCMSIPNEILDTAEDAGWRGLGLVCDDDSSSDDGGYCPQSLTGCTLSFKGVDCAASGSVVWERDDGATGAISVKCTTMGATVCEATYNVTLALEK